MFYVETNGAQVFHVRKRTRTLCKSIGREVYLQNPVCVLCVMFFYIYIYIYAYFTFWIFYNLYIRTWKTHSAKKHLHFTQNFFHQDGEKVYWIPCRVKEHEYAATPSKFKPQDWGHLRAHNNGVNRKGPSIKSPMTFISGKNIRIFFSKKCQTTCHSFGLHIFMFPNQS